MEVMVSKSMPEMPIMCADEGSDVTRAAVKPPAW